MLSLAVLLTVQGCFLILVGSPCRLASCFCAPLPQAISWLTYCPSVYLPVIVPSFRLAYRLCIPPDFGCFPNQAGSLPMRAHLLLDELLIYVCLSLRLAVSSCGLTYPRLVLFPWWLNVCMRVCVPSWLLPLVG